MCLTTLSWITNAFAIAFCGLTQNDWAFERASFKAGREAIQNYVLVASIELSREASDGVRRTPGIAKFWIDQTNGRFRFDRTNDQEFNGANGSNFRAWKGAIQNERGVSVWDNHRLEYHPASRDFRGFESLGWFDIRCVGMFSVGDFISNAEATRDFESVVSSFLSTAGNEEIVVDNAEGLVFRRRGTGSMAEFISMVDIKRAPHCVLRSSRIFALVDGKDLNFSECSVDYTTIKGVDVPSRCRLLSRDLSPERFVDELDIRFEWKSINEPIDPSVFDKDVWPIPKGSYVYSRETVAPVLVEIAGFSNEEFAARVSPQVGDAPKSDWLRNPLVVVNFVAVIGLFVWFVLKRRRRNVRESQ